MLMRRHSILTFGSMALALASVSIAADQSWPQFRGTHAGAVSRRLTRLSQVNGNRTGLL